MTDQSQPAIGRTRKPRVRGPELAIENEIEANKIRHSRLSEERKKDPSRFTSTSDDRLYVENVAELLGCSVQTVRRIPKAHLSPAKIGRRSVYLRQDVINYISYKSKFFPTVANATPNPASPPTNTFDPVLFLKQSQKSTKTNGKNG
ncbi:helix-turn-helix domain-containing protein [Hirschia litorea]|uniref:Helix-turn-helix domain-containing protein n=1 Tax=Hirschia litorea TaxID=1199156 RepID=A0ABW2INX1_9PROT